MLIHDNGINTYINDAEIATVKATEIRRNNENGALSEFFVTVQTKSGEQFRMIQYRSSYYRMVTELNHGSIDVGGDLA
ncbi:MAG: hypothetical protein LBU19_05160 [Treponema sp.]|jgi:hypothetical protein|nr:hypothetical protein [Treponema sp.]